MIIINLILKNFGLRNKMNSLILNYKIKISKILILMHWLKLLLEITVLKLVKIKTLNLKWRMNKFMKQLLLEKNIRKEKIWMFMNFYILYNNFKLFNKISKVMMNLKICWINKIKLFEKNLIIKKNK
jgi:hypothetical protein